PHGAQADIQIEDLAQRDVERAEATADRRGEWTLDPDEVFAELRDRVFGQPITRVVEGLLAGEHLEPLDRATVLLRRSIEHELGCGPDVDAGAVAFDERDD